MVQLIFYNEKLLFNCFLVFSASRYESSGSILNEIPTFATSAVNYHEAIKIKASKAANFAAGFERSKLDSIRISFFDRINRMIRIFF